MEERRPKKARRLPPVHPGEILREDLLKPLGISINRLGRDLRVPVTRMSEIANGRRGITADTALRLARYFGTTPEFWMNLQAAYDLDSAQRVLVDRIVRDVHPRDAETAQDAAAPVRGVLSGRKYSNSAALVAEDRKR
jgi:antitoxin HigA-1